ncbi:MAG: hypothetical protein PWP34_1748 [Desulfuromonadales bacterium]|nr:hypothetical protein [Desulfuromonadales bacterium]
MRYMAHFSFDEDHHKKHGYFTMLLSADSTQGAIKSLHEKIMAIRNGTHAFDDIDEIYLDDIIEIDHFPEKPVLMRYESMDLADQTTLSSNPIDQKGLHVFHWWPKGKEEEYRQEKYDIEPFVRWH